MSWLDSDTGRSGECNNSPTLSISNIKIKTGGSSPGPTPPTPPSPGNYDYGNQCGSRYDDECNGCDCYWSWPHNDPAKWNSRNAHCRCKTSSLLELDEDPLIVFLV